jgi:hypothetical protein
LNGASKLTPRDNDSDKRGNYAGCRVDPQQGNPPGKLRPKVAIDIDSKHFPYKKDKQASYESLRKQRVLATSTQYSLLVALRSRNVGSGRWQVMLLAGRWQGTAILRLLLRRATKPRGSMQGAVSRTTRHTVGEPVGGRV